MNNLNEFLGGRILDLKSVDEITVKQLLDLGGEVVPAFYKKDKHEYCRRCLSKIDSKINYCRSCLGMGKITREDQLLISPSEAYFEFQESPMMWDGILTQLQEKASQELINAFYQNDDHLIWAVTGAGKTEMTFPLISEIIKSGKRIALCSPRVDVCIELFPRIKAAFPQTTIGLYHGKSEESYQITQIMIATIHQLIRFEKAFDVLIVDEVDSYPLAGSSMLQNAIIKSVKVINSIYYLSATPPKVLLDKVRNKQLGMSKLYQRFHGHPLPEPRCHLLYKSTTFLKINPMIQFTVKKLIKRNQRFMMFFSNIPQMLYFEKYLKLKFPQLEMISVSSKDDDRLSKVQQFRDFKKHAILTTTILERGVTFKNVAVIVIDADASEFSKTALIQIAGRAGRSADSFDDEVHFYYQNYNKQIKEACNEIKYLNWCAKNV
ncbi:ComF operon protein 1 [Companilactobacillus tucceti DSM 20183]|uniref:ComF operon protein 1 n=1 Tax=Companilactobacillus tucceti DSM 20183 TaxID=1423811 RepID=A0A0R1JA76_9LACO|nr:DEAD/DEAH box helicase family protein [Companilactobacillus tucceti]KRK64890.1 ComF operon protein 1 [Companilactobacillus tucceti DSM 20183]